MVKKLIVFDGIAKPTLGWAGTEIQKKTGRDKFGKIQRGEYRECLIQTKWGQMRVAYPWMGKHIRIIAEARQQAKKEEK